MIRALWSRIARGGQVRRAPTGVAVDDALPADRGVTFAKQTRSLQSRMNSILALGLVGGIAVMMVTWYYGQAVHSGGHAPVTQSIGSRVGVVGPPPLGALPAPLELVEQRMKRPSAGIVHGTHGATNSTQSGLLALLKSARPVQAPAPARLGAQRELRPHAIDRQLQGNVFIGASSAVDGEASNGGRSAAGRLARRRNSSGGGSSTLHQLLHASVMSATQAHRLPQQRLLLAKGTFIDCTLETAIDSTLPGMTTCITATDTFSADGTVVLLPRGTQLIGQTRGQVRQGMGRVFVIWTEARTPSGVIVRLDSPSTDAVGRSGLSGKVNRHFWERFGAAMLVSTLTGVVQSRVESASGTVIVDPTAGEEVVAQTLRGTQDIAPTITVSNGQRIEVLVARDVDFTPVYALVAR